MNNKFLTVATGVLAILTSGNVQANEQIQQITGNTNALANQLPALSSVENVYSTEGGSADGIEPDVRETDSNQLTAQLFTSEQPFAKEGAASVVSDAETPQDIAEQSDDEDGTTTTPTNTTHIEPTLVETTQQFATALFGQGSSLAKLIEQKAIKVYVFNDDGNIWLIADKSPANPNNLPEKIKNDFTIDPHQTPKGAWIALESWMKDDRAEPLNQFKLMGFPGNKLLYLKIAITRVKLPGTCHTIPSEAFRNCSNLTNISIPESVHSIGEQAFRQCNAMREIALPVQLQTLGDSAFYDCNYLESINLPPEVTILPPALFSHCRSLASIELPYVQTLSSQEFQACRSLTQLSLAEGVIEVPSDFCHDCSGLREVHLSSTVTTLNDRAFVGCSSLNSINLDKNLTAIGYGAFRGCISLGRVSISSEVKVIKQMTFYGCTTLVEVKLSENITEIEPMAFQRCVSLRAIDIPFSVTQIMQLAFDQCTRLAQVTMREGILELGDSVFAGCLNLKRITIPRSVQVINAKNTLPAGVKITAMNPKLI